MIFNWRIILTGLLLAAFVAVGGLAGYYRYAAAEQLQRADTAERQFSQANHALDEIQRRQREIAALDDKYTRELNDAKTTIDRLQRDVAAGRKRLRVAATCPAASAAASRLDDAAGARLNDAAERNYFTLRERIEIAKKQITGLQNYIKQQCFNASPGFGE